MQLSVWCLALPCVARFAALTRCNNETCSGRNPFDDTRDEAFNDQQIHRQASHTGISTRTEGSTGHHCTMAMPNEKQKIQTNAGKCKRCATGSGALAANVPRAGEHCVAHSRGER
ncbi:hypothetical protein [Advenella sp. FME57]|uniref:hypothetical protein n=1 Tax=Advenella sp. FME57 TaxID=2742604 RepID=UPI001D033BB6|nr:hypothetical protein [Advenella sp. FME57]